jgi:hypothetical protein
MRQLAKREFVHFFFSHLESRGVFPRGATKMVVLWFFSKLCASVHVQEGDHALLLPASFWPHVLIGMRLSLVFVPSERTPASQSITALFGNDCAVRAEPARRLLLTTAFSMTAHRRRDPTRGIL